MINQQPVFFRRTGKTWDRILFFYKSTCLGQIDWYTVCILNANRIYSFKLKWHDSHKWWDVACPLGNKRAPSLQHVAAGKAVHQCAPIHAMFTECNNHVLLPTLLQSIKNYKVRQNVSGNPQKQAFSQHPASIVKLILRNPIDSPYYPQIIHSNICSELKTQRAVSLSRWSPAI